MASSTENLLTSLDILRVDLDKTDQHLVALLAKRLELARKIEVAKRSNGEPILSEEAERARLEIVNRHAAQKGLNNLFVEGLFHSLFAESCRVQVRQRNQMPIDAAPPLENEEARYLRLKENLLELTRYLLAERGAYNLDSFGSIAYLEFEAKAIRTQVSTLESLGNTDVAVDLGCGVGSVVFSLTPHFKLVKGYDISPSMIGQAEWIKKMTLGDTLRASFEIHDIEDGLKMLPDASVALATMTMGTASDIRGIRHVLSAINRILNKDGRFVLSFYNSAALFYRWSLPWQVSLMAEIDPVDHFLHVKAGDKTFQVYARPYTKREVQNLLRSSGFKISDTWTYPTLAAIMPNELFYGVDAAQRVSHRPEVRAAVRQEEETKKAIRTIDRGMANSDMGAYILVTGRKA